MCKSVSTGQLQKRGNVTEEVVNLVQMTEMQREDLARLPYLHWDSTGPGAHSQLEAHLWGHDQGIVQRVTDSHTAVTGHHCPEQALSGSEDKEEAHLGGTVQDKYSSVLSPKVHQNPRESDRHVQISKEEKFARKKYMGFCRAGSSIVSIIMRLFPVKIMM